MHPEFGRGDRQAWSALLAGATKKTDMEKNGTVFFADCLPGKAAFELRLHALVLGSPPVPQRNT